MWSNAKGLCPERAARLLAQRIPVSGLLVHHFDLLVDHLANYPMPSLQLFLEVTIDFGSMLDSVDTNNFLCVIDPIKDAPITYP